MIEYRTLSHFEMRRSYRHWNGCNVGAIVGMG
jgi:hypothetical protein